jgi:hypothetical protein
VISFTNTVPSLDCVDDLATHCANITTLLNAIPESDKLNPELSEEYFDGDRWEEMHITTDDEDALKLTHELGFLNEFQTIIHAVTDHYCNDTCCDCIDEQVEHALDHTYSIVVNKAGELELQFGPLYNYVKKAQSKQLELAAAAV